MELSTDAIDIAALVSNGRDSATVMVKLPSDRVAVRFAGIGRDDDGAYLLDRDGDVSRIGMVDPDEFDDMMGYPNLRLLQMDEDGYFLEEYDIAAVSPEQTAAFGA